MGPIPFRSIPFRFVESANGDRDGNGMKIYSTRPRLAALP